MENGVFGFDNRLHKACALGDTNLLKKLLREDARIARTPIGDRKSTPLHIAAEYGHEPIMDILLSTDAVEDILSQDHEGDTPIHVATDDIDILRKLFVVFARLDPPKHVDDLVNTKKRTPLHYAAGKGDLDVVEFLLEKGAKKFARDEYGATPFHFAARYGKNILLMEKLRGKDDDAKTVDDVNNDGITALHYASWNGRIEAVEWLLENGALVSKQDAVKGDTALHWASRMVSSEEKSLEVINLLIEKIVDEQSKKEKEKGADESLQLKREKDADLFAPNHKGELAIGLAHDNQLKGTAAHIVESICSAMRKLDSQESYPEPHHSIYMVRHTDGATLAHYAAAYGAKEDVEWLLSQMRAAAARSKKGKDRSFGIIVNIKDKKDRNLFHWAAIKGNIDIVETLYDHKVDPLAEDNKGNTPLCLALINNHLDFAEKLINKLGKSLDKKTWEKDIGQWTSTLTENFSLMCDKFKSHMVGSEEADIINEIPPIYKALHAGEEETAKFIQKHSDGIYDVLNVKGSITGRTALHWATILKDEEILYLLCNESEFSSDLVADVKDSNGKTPLDYATDVAIVTELLKIPDIRAHVRGLYEDRQVYVYACNAILVGAALITGVTFAGWLHPPSNKSYITYHHRRSALRIFWIFNSLSFFFSLATVVAAASSVLPVPYKDIAKVVTSIRKALLLAASLLAISIVFVFCAFAAAGFVVLPLSFKYKIYMICTASLGGVICLIFIGRFFLHLGNILYSSETPQREHHLICGEMPPNDQQPGYERLAPSGEIPQSGQQPHLDQSSGDIDQIYKSREIDQIYKIGKRYDYLSWDDGIDDIQELHKAAKGTS